MSKVIAPVCGVYTKVTVVEVWIAAMCQDIAREPHIRNKKDTQTTEV